MDLLKPICISFSLCVLGACTMPVPVFTKLYEGPELPNSEISIIGQKQPFGLAKDGNGNVMAAYLQLVSVDGIAFTKPKGIAGAQVTPGKHTFEYAIYSSTWLPLGVLFKYEETYKLEVNTPKGKKGVPALKTPNLSSKSVMCMIFVDVNQPYPYLEPSDLPPSTPYEYQCNSHEIRFNDSNKKWISAGNGN